MKLAQLASALSENKVTWERADYLPNGLQKFGSVETSYQNLVSKFGEPEWVDDDGTRVQWDINIHENGETIPVTIYDWHEDDAETPIEQVTNWNIGSTKRMGYLNAFLIINNKL